MPNWISGSLKLRGNYENVKRFFFEGINQYEDIFDEGQQKWVDTLIPKEKWFKAEEYGEPGARELDIELANGWTYVEGTRRAFISTNHSSYISVYEHDQEDEDKRFVTAACEINQAWYFRYEDWIEIAKKYELSIRLWGLECGMCYGREIEIGKDGKIIFSKTLKYNDWDWECPLPWMGG